MSLETKVCLYCGKHFETAYHAKYCCRDCCQRARNRSRANAKKRIDSYLPMRRLERPTS